MSVEIIQHDGDKQDILRGSARDITQEDFDSGYVQNVFEQMHTALAARDDGVAIAAPQIGEPLRMFAVAGKIFPHEEGQPTPKDLVFINPRIIERSEKTEPMEEGCLSVNGLYGNVERSVEVTLTAQNVNGVETTVKGSGLLSQIFQHECDHLDGTLFIDKATNLHKPKHEA